MAAHAKAATGSIHVSSNSLLTTLKFSFPLRLMALPRTAESSLRKVFILGFGGGLVSADSVDLQVTVDASSSLLLLSQSATKVFKSHGETTTLNSLTASVHTRATLLILPEPVILFRNASFTQIQNINLDPLANLVFLDWFTAGRVSRGEKWEFSKYSSTTTIRRGGVLIARDATLLDHLSLDSAHPAPSLAVGPFTTFATLIFVGPNIPLPPKFTSQINPYAKLPSRAAQAQLLVSASPLPTCTDGLIIRIAGVLTDDVRAVIRSCLNPVQALLGNLDWSRI